MSLIQSWRLGLGRMNPVSLQDIRQAPALPDGGIGPCNHINPWRSLAPGESLERKQKIN